MKEWLAQQVAKYLGPTFVSRAATSLVALVLGYLNSANLGLAPEVLTQFGDSATKVVTAGLSLLSIWAVDRLFAKKAVSKEDTK